MDVTSPFSRYWRGLKGPESRKTFADAAGTTVGHCNNLAYRKARTIGPDLGARLVKASQGALTFAEVCPQYPDIALREVA